MSVKNAGPAPPSSAASSPLPVPSTVSSLASTSAAVYWLALRKPVASSFQLVPSKRCHTLDAVLQRMVPTCGLLMVSPSSCLPSARSASRMPGVYSVLCSWPTVG